MATPEVAIIIVNYNGLEDTADVIRSLDEQESKVKVIVVDNASANGEADQLRKLHPQAHVISMQENLGFAGANNAGIRYALDQGYQYVMLLNNDTVVTKGMIAKLLQYTDRSTVTTPAIYYHSFPDELWYGGGRINRKTGNAEHLTLHEQTKVDFASGCCMLMHRDVPEKAGFLDDRYFMYCEDMDYCLRLEERGISILYVPSAKLFHKVGKSSGGSGSAFSIYYITRNRLNCVKEHNESFSAGAYAFSYWSRVARMAALAVRGKKEWKAFRDGIRDHRKGLWGNTFITRQ